MLDGILWVLVLTTTLTNCEPVVNASTPTPIPTPSLAAQPKTTTPRKPFGRPQHGANQIFFVKTSCPNFDARPGLVETQLDLEDHMVCALESTARANPKVAVYLYQPCPIDEGFLGRSRSLVRKLFDGHDNVFLCQETVDEMFANSPLEEFLKTGKLYESKDFVHHASDVLRYLILWKFGGVYLDLDFISIRSLSPLPGNFVALESRRQANVAAMGVTTPAGTALMERCMQELRLRFDAEDHNGNGPKLLTRVLKGFCPMETMTERSAAQCHGVAVLPRTTFYPVPAEQWRSLYSEDAADEVGDVAEDSYAVHLYNSMKRLTSSRLETRVARGQRHAVAALQRRYCPATYGEVDWECRSRAGRNQTEENRIHERLALGKLGVERSKQNYTDLVKCVKDSGASDDDLEAYLHSSLPEIDTWELKCVTGCFFEWANVIANGKLNRNRFVQVLMEDMSYDRASDAADQCFSLLGDVPRNKCEMGAVIEGCLRKSTN